MRHYRLTALLVFVYFVAASGIERMRETGWVRLWGAAELVLAVCIVAGAGKEIRDGVMRRNSRADSAGQDG
ncbi:hypothetical protein [Streptomyces sp. NPDC058330]|uniref:hypothetical protein n=1 Tax=Streptomyces sp. NPDC058330 TaxID=3346449 RepID=UPI0036E67D05